MEEIKIEIYGRVQGVNLRAIVRDFAEENGLKGFVRNREDGSVSIVAQGERKKLDELLDWIRASPGFSKIEGLSYKWQKPSIEYKEFTVVREQGYIMDKARSVVNLGKQMIWGSGSEEKKVPVHIAIIPDGNRRWAKEKGLVSSLGHYKSGHRDNIKELLEEARKLGVKCVSIWGFSTENWSRDKEEIKAIFDLVLKNVLELEEDAEKNKIRFRHIGRKDRLPKELVSAMARLEEKTKNYSEFNVNLFLDYGGRDEIVRAVNRMVKEGVKKVDEKALGSYLDTVGIPDPDLIIRTSGEKRISGLMPWQSVYAEYYFTDTHFPDFDACELRKAIEDYGKRERRFGSDAKK